MLRLLLIQLLGLAMALSSARGQTGEQPVAIDTLQLESRVFGNTRAIRVAVPPGYHDPANRERSYPVLYLNDGIMAFHPPAVDAPSVVRRLVLAGQIEPLIVVGIDNGGSTDESTNPGRDRANEFLPYPDQGFPPNKLYPAETPNPIGGRYPTFLADEVIPLIKSRYRVLADAEHTGIGGFSYGGVAALYTAMTRPDLAGKLLLESTPLWIGPDRRLLKEAVAARRWPERIAIGSGSAESPDAAVRREGRTDTDSLIAAIRRAAPNAQVKLDVVAGAKHEPSAWRARLPAALRFLFGTR